VASNSKRSRDDEAKFTEAEKNWNLENLYEDLRVAKQRCGCVKRKVLTETEKCHLRGLLCGYSPEEIAKKRGVGFGTIKDTLSKTLYRYIEDLLNYEEKIRHWADVSDFLEKAGYKIQVSEQSQPSHPLPDKNENTLEISHNTESNSIREWHFKSVDQLWSKDIGERISGIRKLERIAKDYPSEHWAIMEELAEFVRIMAPGREEKEGEERSPNISPDIQAALTVIGRRDWNRPIQALDLSNTELRGANLNRANLQGVNLDGANLQEVRLIAANLERATLKRANLEGVIMHKANLQRANLEEAKLQGADLDMTDLQEADLFSTYLQRTRLRAANLQRARLPRANLQGAFLSDVNWQGAALPGVNLRGADLTRAKNLDSGELEETYGDRKAASSLPENVKAPEYWVQSN
jgi:hypothetical protein